MHYEEGLGWDISSLTAVFAPACLELGVVFLISKFFFMAEDAELQVERLEEMLAEARRSPGVGLAMSYFFNFLVPTCANLNDKVLDTSMTINGKLCKLTSGSHFFVFVPRALDGDLKQKLQSMQQKEGVAQGMSVFIDGNEIINLFLDEKGNHQNLVRRIVPCLYFFWSMTLRRKHADLHSMFPL